MILNFDASKIEITNSFELIPDGIYTAVISGTEWKETKDKTGGYLSLKVEIIDGQYKGRVVFDMLNLQNKNATAVNIAEQTLAKICLAINKPNLQDSSEMLNIPLSIKLGTQAAQGAYEAQNKIKGYLPTGTTKTVATQTPSAHAGDAKPPWAR